MVFVRPSLPYSFSFGGISVEYEIHSQQHNRLSTLKVGWTMYKVSKTFLSASHHPRRCPGPFDERVPVSLHTSLPEASSLMRVIIVVRIIEPSKNPNTRHATISITTIFLVEEGHFLQTTFTMSKTCCSSVRPCVSHTSSFVRHVVQSSDYYCWGPSGHSLHIDLR